MVRYCLMGVKPISIRRPATRTYRRAGTEAK